MDMGLKMRYLRRVVLAAAAFIPFTAAYSQNFAPTVVVTNKYVAQTLTPQKEELEMAVPDSVKSFNMTFDYSVFDRPYRGAYEFRPYSVDMRTVPEGHRAGKFYLNAGAGYTLHPELDLVWSPLGNGKVSLDLYAGHRSFIGDWRRVDLGGDGLLTSRRGEDGKRQYWGDWNYDMDNSAGAALHYDWKRTSLAAGLAYDGLLQRDWLGKRGFNRALVDVRVFSKDSLGGVLSYDARLRYSFGRDNVERKYSSAIASAASGASVSSGISGSSAVSGESTDWAVDENLFGASLKMDIGISDDSRFAFDFATDAATYRSGMDHIAMLFDFAPKYVLTRKSWTFSLGARVSVPTRPSGADGENGAHSQYVYPDIRISYDFRKIPLNFWMSVGGGEKMNSYSSIVGGYRHYSIASALSASPHRVLGNSVERCGLALGLKGSIRSVFGYELFASASCLGSGVLESVRLASLNVGGKAVTLPVYDLEYLNSLHGRLLAGLKMHYGDDWGRIELDLLYDSLLTGEGGEFVRPAALTGDFSVQFNIIRRIYALVGCDFSTARSGRMDGGDGKVTEYKIPGWGDPYFSLEYRYSRRTAFWLKGSRFTGQTIQRTPLYAERGPELTAGVRLSFGK